MAILVGVKKIPILSSCWVADGRLTSLRFWIPSHRFLLLPLASGHGSISRSNHAHGSRRLRLRHWWRVAACGPLHRRGSARSRHCGGLAPAAPLPGAPPGPARRRALTPPSCASPSLPLPPRVSLLHRFLNSSSCCEVKMLDAPIGSYGFFPPFFASPLPVPHLYPRSLPLRAALPAMAITTESRKRTRLPMRSRSGGYGLISRLGNSL